jgi:hypothetical protein
MSKLAKAIDYEVGKDYFYKQVPYKLKYTDVKFSVADDMSMIGTNVREYKIGVTLRAVKYCTEADREVAVKILKRAMIEEIFGEFRPMIYNLHAALYDRDTDEAEKIVREMDRVMFHEGLE